MKIDIHSHVYPQKYLDLLSERDVIPRIENRSDGKHLMIFPGERERLGDSRAINSSYWNLDEKITFMKKYNINRTMLSLGNPWLDFLRPSDSIKWAAIINEEIEALAEERDCFEGMAVVPMQSIKGTNKELDHIKTLKHLRAVSIGTRPKGKHLDDPCFNTFWEKIEELQMPVFIHPHYTIGIEEMFGYGHAMPLSLGFTYETTLSVARVILGGVLDRFPGIKLILAHAGGTIFFIYGRIGYFTEKDPLTSKNMQLPFVEYLKKIYYDAITYSAPALQAAIKIAGAERFFFGTDHPFSSTDSVESIVRDAVGSSRDSSKILQGNAERWIQQGSLD